MYNLVKSVTTHIHIQLC